MHIGNRERYERGREKGRERRREERRENETERDSTYIRWEGLQCRRRKLTSYFH